MPAKILSNSRDEVGKFKALFSSENYLIVALFNSSDWLYKPVQMGIKRLVISLRSRKRIIKSNFSEITVIKINIFLPKPYFRPQNRIHYRIHVFRYRSIWIKPDTGLLLDSLHNCRVSDEPADSAKWTTKDLPNYVWSFIKIHKVLVWKILPQSKVPK